jgi:hypothetical protein
VTTFGGIKVGAGLTWSGKELPSSGRGDLTVVGFSSNSVMTMVGMERVCKRGNVL